MLSIKSVYSITYTESVNKITVTFHLPSGSWRSDKKQISIIYFK